MAQVHAACCATYYVLVLSVQAMSVETFPFVIIAPVSCVMLSCIVVGKDDKAIGSCFMAQLPGHHGNHLQMQALLYVSTQV